MKNKNILVAFLIAVIVFATAGCGNGQEAQVEPKGIGVEEDNALLIHFQEEYPENDVILCEYGDVTDDGVKDLIVLYNIKKGKNGMRIVIGSEEEDYSISNEVPAPIEEQMIKFKDIDNEGKVEFIVSGSKNGNVGYAIFRLEDMDIINLFGEGMEDCC